MVIEYSDRIIELKQNILYSIKVLEKQLAISIKNVKSLKQENSNNFSSLPAKEKILRSIERQQNIKETLYLFLLQKREEASVAKAITTPSIKIVDYAMTNYVPIAPKRSIIYLVALFIGLIVPFGIVYVIFLMDTNLKGISATKLDKLGWRASDTAEIAFDNVAIPEENLMGEEGKGFSYIMQHFAFERLIMAINAHARAEYAIDYTIDYMSQREAFGTKINKFQALRHTMVEHATDVEHCKIFNYAAAARLDKGEYVVKEATMAKLKSTKVADETIYSCLQMLGGYGYMEEYPLARLFRDSRLGPIGGGTSEIMKEILSKMILDKQNYKPAVE